MAQTTCSKQAISRATQSGTSLPFQIEFTSWSFQLAPKLFGMTIINNEVHCLFAMALDDRRQFGRFE